MRNFWILITGIALAGCLNPSDCKKAVCTMQFAMVTVQLSDTAGPDLSGIRTETLLKHNGALIHTQSGPGALPDRTFTIADDSDLSELGFNQSREVVFVIFKNGVLVKSVPFTIRTDCCHVSKTEGPDEIRLNP